MNTEKELISACISGNRIMQNKLYAQFAPVMFIVCLRYAKNKPDAEEILQEGFIKVFTCLHQYQFKGPLEAWIRKIMVNCALGKIRSKNLLYPLPQTETITEDYKDQEVILEGINAREVIRLIQQLPTMCRLVFNLYVFEGMKHRQIAKYLHISEGTSKSNLHDARLLLQRQWQEQHAFLQLNSGA